MGTKLVLVVDVLQLLRIVRRCSQLKYSSVLRKRRTIKVTIHTFYITYEQNRWDESILQMYGIPRVNHVKGSVRTESLCEYSGIPGVFPPTTPDSAEAWAAIEHTHSSISLYTVLPGSDRTGFAILFGPHENMTGGYRNSVSEREGRNNGQRHYQNQAFVSEGTIEFRTIFLNLNSTIFYSSVDENNDIR